MTVTGAVFKDIADAIREKDGLGGVMKISQMAERIRNIETGSGGGGNVVDISGKGVRFIDFNGDGLYFYTKEEFLALTTMPDNPEHEGLVAEGWNWSLEDAQDYVRRVDDLTIGQNYHTADGKLHMILYIPGVVTISTRVYIANGNDVLVDWGDGTSNESKNIQIGFSELSHQYHAPGYYDIAVSGTATLSIAGNGTNGTNLGNGSYLCRWSYGSTNQNISFRGMIRAVYMPQDARLSTDAFNRCNKLKEVSISRGINSISSQAFYYCSALTGIVIPNGIKALNSYAFNNTQCMWYIAIPKSVATIGLNCFTASRLKKLSIPDNTSVGSNATDSLANLDSISIGAGVTFSGGLTYASLLSEVIVDKSAVSIPFFSNAPILVFLKIQENMTAVPGTSNCYGLSIIDCSECKSIITIESSTVNTCPILRVIVPDEFYEDWKVATNWSVVANRIIKKSEAIEYGGTL